MRGQGAIEPIPRPRRARHQGTPGRTARNPPRRLARVKGLRIPRQAYIRAAKRLRDAGFDERQAEAAVSMVRDAAGADREQLATKADLDALESRVDAKLAALETRLRADLAPRRPRNLALRAGRYWTDTAPSTARVTPHVERGLASASARPVEYSRLPGTVGAGRYRADTAAWMPSGARLPAAVTELAPGSIRPARRPSAAQAEKRSAKGRGARSSEGGYTPASTGAGYPCSGNGTSRKARRVLSP